MDNVSAALNQPTSRPETGDEVVILSGQYRDVIGVVTEAGEFLTIRVGWFATVRVPADQVEVL